MLRRLVRTMSTSSSAGPLEKKIVAKIELTFNPIQFTIANDSHKHSKHAPMQDAENKTESHFRILVVSDQFAGKSLPVRHKMVYSAIAEEMVLIHALQMKTQTPEEWEKKKTVSKPVTCKGESA